MQTCYFGSFEMNSSIDDFYKSLDNSMHILNIANGRKYDIPDYQKNLIYLKAVEIREDYQKKMEEDAKIENIASSQNTMEELRSFLAMRTKEN